LKGKHLTTLLISIIVVLILVLVATTCTPTATTPTQTTSKPAATTTTTPTTTTKVEYKDTIYRVLNPRGRDSAVTLIGMQTPRLTTLVGKTIVINMGEGSPVVMPALNERMKKELTQSTILFQGGPTFLTAMPPETEKVANLMIMGNSW
jgi:hypothetical protein